MRAVRPDREGEKKAAMWKRMLQQRSTSDGRERERERFTLAMCASISASYEDVSAYEGGEVK